MEARMTKAMYNAFFGFAGVTIAIVAVAIPQMTPCPPLTCPVQGHN